MDYGKIIKKLGLDFSFDFEKIATDAEKTHQLRRRIRYYCYKKRNNTEGVEVPIGLVKHFESQDNFEGWEGFANTWDVSKDNPTKIYFRDFSVEEEWEATIRRVVPELPIDRVHRQKDN